MIERLMKIDEVAEYFSLNARTLRRMWERGDFPKPIRLGACLRWRRQTLDEFIATKYEQVQDEAAVH